MKRPKITLENHEKVYNYYRNYQQPSTVSQIAWRAFDGIYRPRVSFVDGAQEQMNELRADGTPQIFAFNHLTDLHDQFVSAATLRQITPEAIGNTRVLTKDPLMREVKHLGLGHLGDALGGIPVFRKKDHADHTVIDAANDELFDTVAWIIADNQNLAIYPEGTHNKGDARKLGKVRTGIGEIATRVAAQYAPVAITPIGISYGLKKSLLPRHANVIVGNTIEIKSYDTVDDITEKTRDRLQDLVTIAFELYKK
jgi:1-acyl-sn-glycerol-3-phosphate acyltransferase